MLSTIEYANAATQIPRKSPLLTQISSKPIFIFPYNRPLTTSSSHLQQHTHRKRQTISHLHHVDTLTLITTVLSGQTRLRHTWSSYFFTVNYSYRISTAVACRYHASCIASNKHPPWLDLPRCSNQPFNTWHSLLYLGTTTGDRLLHSQQHPVITKSPWSPSDSVKPRRTRAYFRISPPHLRIRLAKR